MLSRQTNDVGTYENIVGTYPNEETVVYQWDAVAQQYVTNEFLFGSWEPGPAEPVFAVGESVWVSSVTEPPPPIGVQPIIIAQPTNLIVQLGDPATFAVTVANAKPLIPCADPIACGGAAYQWFFNSFPIPGATNSSFTIVSVQSNNLGAYNVAVSNSFGMVTSTPGTVTNSELVVSQSANGSNCCWTFLLSQSGGFAGDITSITATFAAGNSPGIEFTSASGPPGAPSPTSTMTSDTWFTPGPNGLINGNSIEVTACFNFVPATRR